MDRNLRKEIEEADAALKSARAELAAARELAAQAPLERAARLAELRSQLAANLAALEALSATVEGFEEERRQLRRQINAGRTTVSTYGRPPAPAPDQRSTTLEDVVRPKGWRTNQPWYSRLLWWIFGAKEW